MSPDEWDQAVGWAELRWPHLSWTAATVAAVYQDLHAYELVDVMTGLRCLYESGEPLLGPAALRAETGRAAEKRWVFRQAQTPAPPRSADTTALPRLLAAEGVGSLRELVAKHRDSDLTSNQDGLE